MRCVNRIGRQIGSCGGGEGATKIRERRTLEGMQADLQSSGSCTLGTWVLYEVIVAWHSTLIMLSAASVTPKEPARFQKSYWVGSGPTWGELHQSQIARKLLDPRNPKKSPVSTVW
jgi:hypothetical protein